MSNPERLSERGDTCPVLTAEHGEPILCTFRCREDRDRVCYHHTLNEREWADAHRSKGNG